MPGRRTGTEAYRPVACDLVGFWRPRLQDCSTKHSSSVAGQALPAIALGIAARVGDSRDTATGSPMSVRTDGSRRDGSNGVAEAARPADAGALGPRRSPRDGSGRSAGTAPRGRHHAGCQSWPEQLDGPARLRCLCTVARAVARPQAPWCVRCHGPLRGAHARPRRPTGVRPGRVAHGRPRVSSRLSSGHHLVLPEASPGAPTCTTVVLHDPRFAEPWLLNTPLPSVGRRRRRCLRDRWPVEGLPLWAKHMLGAARQFVFAPESRQRLPAVTLLAGHILAYTAATQPALPTGFWDRAPRRRLDGYAACWRRGISKTCRSCPSTFAKNRRPPRTCPQAFVGIADSGREERYAMTCPWQHKHNPYFHRKVELKLIDELSHRSTDFVLPA